MRPELGERSFKQAGGAQGAGQSPRVSRSTAPGGFDLCIGKATRAPELLLSHFPPGSSTPAGPAPWTDGPRDLCPNSPPHTDQGLGNKSSFLGPVKSLEPLHEVPPHLKIAALVMQPSSPTRGGVCLEPPTPPDSEAGTPALAQIKAAVLLLFSHTRSPDLPCPALSCHQNGAPGRSPVKGTGGVAGQLQQGREPL